MDEVGRGCIAGPVCAGAVIFNLEIKSNTKLYQDSKKISESNRELISEEIKKNHLWALGWASAEEVDQLNIRQASLLAMKRAVDTLLFQDKIQIIKQDKIILIDGRDNLPNFVLCPQQSVIKGDQKVKQISAASIVAKVARDQFMKAEAKKYPGYGFEKHKGYGTEEHRNAIAKKGITKIHRKTFGGVKEWL